MSHTANQRKMHTLKKTGVQLLRKEAGKDFELTNIGVSFSFILLNRKMFMYELKG